MGLGLLCVHICRTEPGEPPEDGVMNEVTLPFRHRIRNSSAGDLMPSTLSVTEAPHNIKSLQVSEEVAI